MTELVIAQADQLRAVKFSPPDSGHTSEPKHSKGQDHDMKNTGRTNDQMGIIYLDSGLVVSS